MKQGLSLRVSQHLALTPQLQQSIRLLQLSTLELSQEVEQMLDANPFLEVAEDRAEREDYGLSHADVPVAKGDRVVEHEGQEGNDAASPPENLPDWEGDGTSEVSPNDAEWGNDAPSRSSAPPDDDETDIGERLGGAVSLQAYLHQQSAGLRLGPEDRAALHFLIESLNEDGYLEDNLQTLAESLHPTSQEDLDALVHHFTVALRLLHTLEPVGVGARDLGECLQLQILAQLSALPLLHPGRALWQVALAVCRQPLDLLARRDIKRLVAAGTGGDAEVREALGLIARLEPKPGRRFVDTERNVVVPDVIVVAVKPPGGRGGQPVFRVQLNTDVMPRLKVHDIYANVLRNHRGSRDGAGHAALQQRLQEARWFIKNIQQRFDTILRVSTAIVERQKSFFVHGELAMRPLVLREIADELGLHESTISRVTTAKYMSTPQGTFELKYFFGSGLGTETGGNASSTAVRALIKQFIAAESDAKPLSDNQISDMLKEQGIECARRTVAKYREGLKIPPATLRKTL